MTAPMIRPMIPAVNTRAHRMDTRRARFKSMRLIAEIVPKRPSRARMLSLALLTLSIKKSRGTNQR